MTPVFVRTDVGANQLTINLLFKYRNKIAPYWRDLGMQLLQDKFTDKLNVIEANHPNNVQKCCDKMFQYWLEVDTEANWNKLIDALEIIQQNATAAEVRRDMLSGKVNWLHAL